MTKTTCVFCDKAFEVTQLPLGGLVKCPHCGTKNSIRQPPLPGIRIPDTKTVAARQTSDSPVAPLAERVIANIEKVIVDKRAEIVVTLMA